MYANFKLKFKDKQLRNIMWAAARAYVPDRFEAAMREMQAISPEAHAWLRAIPTNLWARHTFSIRTKCELLSNNICESFNQYIKEARQEPILTMFEAIRRQIMCRFHEKRQWIRKVRSRICPKIVEKIEEYKYQVPFFECWESGSGLWEVAEPTKTYVISINEGTCTCKEWDMTGIPRVHACVAIVNSDREPADYVDDWYTVETYKRAYMNLIVPVPDQSKWVDSKSDPVSPPFLRKAPGRPKKKRRKGSDENQQSNKVSKRGIPMHCSYCGHSDHNVRGCKNIGCLYVRKWKLKRSQVMVVPITSC